mgnify:FL=1
MNMAKQDNPHGLELSEDQRVNYLRMCRGLITDVINGYSITIKRHEKNHLKEYGRSYKQVLREICLALIDSEYPNPNEYSDEEKKKIKQHGYRTTRRMN